MTSPKISTTEEFLAVLPYQLGYRLEECVAIAMVTDDMLGPVARADLPPEHHAKQAAEHLLESLLRVGPQLALLVGYESVAGESRSMMTALHHGLVDAGVRIIDHVVVRDGRWWGRCCRPGDDLTGLVPGHVEGHPMADDASVPAVTEYIAHGRAPLASRDAVSALVTEDPALSAGVGAELERLWDAICGQVDPDGLLDDVEDEVDDRLDEDELLDDDEDELLDEADEWLEEAGEWLEDGEDDEDGREGAEAWKAERRASLDAVLAQLETAVRDAERVPELWARVLAPPGERGDAFEVSDEELARMLRSLASKPWRDALISWMSPVMFPLDQVDAVSSALLRAHVAAGPAVTSERSQTVLRRLLSLTPRVPDAFGCEAAAICTVAGCVAWGVGNGSTAGDAVTRALRVDPDYRLARYLGQMVELQMRPRHAWVDVAA